MRTNLAPLACVALAACAFGAPPGFSADRTTWTLPLVDPLSDGKLLVPVVIDGHGPYLFELDRDAHTVIDPEVALEVGLPVLDGARLDDYGDTTHPAFGVELTNVEVGDLTISLMPAVAIPEPSRFDDDGRRIHGILGREILADSLVFGFDRDRGIAWLETEDTFAPPPDASVLALSNTSSQGTKVYWQPIVEGVHVDGVAVDVHPSFAMLASELADDRWGEARLAPRAWSLDVVDPSGTRRHVDKLGVADRVTVDAVARDHVAFAPYRDKRFDLYHLDGTLGLDFFRPYSVAADWHHDRLYLSRRGDDDAATAIRFARWGGQTGACARPGCAEIELVPPRPERPSEPIIEVRTPSDLDHDLELLVRATDRSGAELPRLEINLPAGVHGMASTLAPQYRDATLALVDASPYPRFCPVTYDGGCVMVETPQTP